MRISWGYKIAGMYLAFVAGILALVFKANSQKWDLVTEQYYEQELKYQDVIDQKARALKLSALPGYKTTPSQLELQLPRECSGSDVRGTVYLYRPSDAALDVRKEFRVTDGHYRLVLPRAASGRYTVKLSWQHNGQAYFDEKELWF